VMRPVTDNRRRCVLDMHVLKTKTVIGELRVPIEWWFGMPWRVIVLRSDSPGIGTTSELIK
jgi:hypothetical protein